MLLGDSGLAPYSH